MVNKMEKINKCCCIIYDTFVDMTKDTDIVDNMIVMTLGHDKVDDNKGSLYKIIRKDDKSLKSINGESLGKNSYYCAVEIKMPELSKTKNKDNDLISLEDNIKRLTEFSTKNINEIFDSINVSNEMITTGQTYNVLYLNEEKTIKIVQCYNGTRYIVSTEPKISKIKKEIEITDENSWIIPTEFTITDFYVTAKDLGTASNILYCRDKLTINVDFSALNLRVIQY